MSEVNWGAIQQFDNPGERFAQAFQQGQQSREQNIAKAAMAALVRDPSNAKAMEALASVNPQAAMQFQEHQRERAKAELGAHYDSVMKGAQLIRQTQPKDQASWLQTLSLAQQAGIDISGVPQQFDPNYVQQVVQLADAFKPQTGQGEPNIAKEVAYYKSIGRDDLAQQLLTNHANPMQAINNGDGTITLARPPAAASLQPGAVVPDPRKQGGQAASPPAPFPGR